MHFKNDYEVFDIVFTDHESIPFESKESIISENKEVIEINTVIEWKKEKYVFFKKNILYVKFFND